MTKFRAILFDNDGVLVDTEKYYYEANREVLAEQGVELDWGQFRRYYLEQNCGAWHLIADASDLQIEQLRAKRDRRYSRLLEQASGDLLIPGVREVVTELRNRFQLAIVTSCLREHFERIHRRTDLLQFFDFILVGEDYQHSKPHPEPYLLAARRTGLQKDQCLVVEDSQRGLSAAKAADLACVVIPTTETRESDFKGAFRVLKSISELPTLLD